MKCSSYSIYSNLKSPSFKGLVLKDGSKKFLDKKPVEELSSLLDAGEDMRNYKYTDLIIEDDCLAIKFKNTSNPEYPTKQPLYTDFYVHDPLLRDTNQNFAQIWCNEDKKPSIWKRLFVPLKFSTDTTRYYRTADMMDGYRDGLERSIEVVKHLESQIAREEKNIPLEPGHWLTKSSHNRVKAEGLI